MSGRRLLVLLVVLARDRKRHTHPGHRPVVDDGPRVRAVAVQRVGCLHRGVVRAARTGGQLAFLVFGPMVDFKLTALYAGTFRPGFLWMLVIVVAAATLVSFVGFVTRYSDTPADEFLLSRYIVTCCVADATIAQVRVVNVPQASSARTSGST